MSTKENDEKSLRKEILQPTDSKEEKPSAGTAASFTAIPAIKNLNGFVEWIGKMEKNPFLKTITNLAGY